MQTIRHDLRRFVTDNCLFGATETPLADEESFLEGGIIDSTGVLELVAFLEQRYDIVIEDEELMPVNLDSIDRLTGFVERKLQAKAAPAIAG
jgi:acyl carrier protein